MSLQHLKTPYHWIYSLFFLYVEPLSIFAGALIAFFLPRTYLNIVHANPNSRVLSDAHPIALETRVLLSQLANVYILFALNEALVLRSTSDGKVWRTMQSVLLIADFGHLCIVFGLGGDVWSSIGDLSAADWGKPLLFMTLRIAFLLRIGLNSTKSRCE